MVIEDDIFLYLPLYYAFHNSCWKFVPANYSLDILPSAAKTDESSLNMLMSDESRYQDIHFALADPTTVLKPRQNWNGRTPVVLASMIANCAFWALDRGSYKVDSVRDLARYDQLIAFPRGTTSYGIARGISRRAAKNHEVAIQEVKPLQELVALQDSDPAKKTLCLSPDILRIKHLIHNYGQFHVDLTLSDTPEFNNVLVTALISRADVVEQHPELVDGLLRALQWALIQVRLATQDVVDYANMRFQGRGVDFVRGALKEAQRVKVYPASIEIQSSYWIKAAEIACESREVRFDDRERELARRAYERMIEPYEHLAQKANKEIYRLNAEPSSGEIVRAPGFWPMRISSALFLLCGLATILFPQWVPKWTSIVVPLWVGGAIWCGALARTALRKAAVARGSIRAHVHWSTVWLFQASLATFSVGLLFGNAKVLEVAGPLMAVLFVAAASSVADLERK